MFRKLLKKIRKKQLRYYLKRIVLPSKQKYAHLKQEGVSNKEYKRLVKKEITLVVFKHYLLPLAIILPLLVNATIYWISVGFGN